MREKLGKYLLFLKQCEDVFRTDTVDILFSGGIDISQHNDVCERQCIGKITEKCLRPRIGMGLEDTDNALMGIILGCCQ